MHAEICKALVIQQDIKELSRCVLAKVVLQAMLARWLVLDREFQGGYSDVGFRRKYNGPDFTNELKEGALKLLVVEVITTAKG